MRTLTITKRIIQALIIGSIATSQVAPAYANSQDNAEFAAVAYPSGEILGYGTDVMGKEWEIRRGFWNGSQGFGYDKVYNYHNITRLSSMQFVISGLEYEPQGTSTITHAYANELRCGVFGCEVTNAIRVRGVLVDSFIADDAEGNPVNGRMGLQTMYCLGFTPTCPAWVTAALNPSDNTGGPYDPGPTRTTNSTTEAELTPANYMSHNYIPVGTVLELSDVQAQYAEFQAVDATAGEITPK